MKDLNEIKNKYLPEGSPEREEYEKELKKELILESNKLLARYLGYEYYAYAPEKAGGHLGWWYKEAVESEDYKILHPKITHSLFLCRTHKDLRFFNDWNLLMRVYKKLMDSPLESNHPYYCELLKAIQDNLLDSNREEFFNSLVEVVKYLKNY